MYDRAHVKPALFRWARERAGISSDALAAKFPNLPLWEKGETLPTMRQLETFARATHAPLGYFFLPSPPRETLPVPDYRTMNDRAVRRPSPDLIDTIRSMQARQEWMREALIEEGEPPVPFVGSLSIHDPIDAAVASLRQSLGLDSEWAIRERTRDDAFRTFRRRIEATGILVVANGIVGNDTHRKLDPKEFRGFVLPDRYAPLVFVNGADAMSARIFTLAHELVHVGIGEGGVFDLPEIDETENATERFCNGVAAEFLAPEADFRTGWSERANATDPAGALDALALRFKVSPLVAARRALDLGLIDRTEFLEIHERYRNMHFASRATGGGDFYRVQESRIGRRFGEYVVRHAREGRLSYRDAYRLTGLYGKTFDTFAERSQA